MRFLSKKFLSFLVTSASISGLLFFSIQPLELKIFSFDGSSSMKPSIDLLTSLYYQINNKSGATISTIGSESGLIRLLNGNTDFAMVSRSVKDLAKDYSQQWSDLGLKTITLAKEAILILYKKPKTCNKELVISSDNILDIYKLFSGYSSSGSKTNLKDFLTGSNSECSAEITAFSKHGGPKKSGTAHAFFNNNNLKTIKNQNTLESKSSDENSNLFEKIKLSNFGDSSNLHLIPESNSLAWSIFKDNLSDGSMIYFPSSFVFQNYDEIIKTGVSIAKFKNDSNKSKKNKNGSEIELNKSNYFKNIRESKYAWFRYLHLVFSTKNLSPDHKKFIEYIVTNTTKLSLLFLVPIKYCIEKDENGSSTSSNSQSNCSSSSAPAPKKQKSKKSKKIKLFEADNVSCNYGLG